MYDGEILDLTGVGVNELDLPLNGRSRAGEYQFWVNLRRECDRDRTPFC
ncbi:hypothetical protein [Laspinema olomoucense]|uniref:Uncharacterized protein n=1 Tax=Laspinema olomoucense D3b TaxID=2953688 RepID=A0ABT2NAD5_9CYAN|nr:MULTISPECIES: hypothetical protein [unclassified Laspinema]MCT7971357.1 hypothetical protein [Laspinema sp. D3d]MCT7979426.1 hypothetical protein [Laspinema sp. D3b]MCT7987229.1 hypothetical protein [Laspinema sp. D3a]MCT7992206.1 hypothetical protein [Laspinema sp. D3c]